MNDIVVINNQQITAKEYKGQRVVTFKDIDLVHNRPEGTASRNLRANREHLMEGVDYFVLELTSDEIRREFGAGKNAPNITLITESGYLMLVKSFTDDLAWDVQRALVNNYFRVKKVVKPKGDDPTKAMRANAMLLNAKSRVAKQMTDLWNRAKVEPQYQALALNNFYDGLEIPRIALKATAVVMLDQTTIAAHLGIMSNSGKPHAQAVGAIINQLGLSADEYTETPYSRNGHDGVAIQYTESVENKVRNWLAENDYPATIPAGDKNYSVRYRPNT